LLPGLRTAVILSRLEQKHIPGVNAVLPVPAQQTPLSPLHKSNDIILMKMIGKGLARTFKAISFYLQFFIKNGCFYFFSHLMKRLLAAFHCTGKLRKRLVKHLQNQSSFIQINCCFSDRPADTAHEALWSLPHTKAWHPA